MCYHLTRQVNYTIQHFTKKLFMHSPLFLHSSLSHTIILPCSTDIPLFSHWPFVAFLAISHCSLCIPPFTPYVLSTLLDQPILKTPVPIPQFTHILFHTFSSDTLSLLNWILSSLLLLYSTFQPRTVQLAQLLLHTIFLHLFPLLYN